MSIKRINRSQYSDLAHWCDDFGWEFYGQQIESGRLDARVSSYTTQHTHLHQTQFNKRLHQRGVSASGFIHFAIPFNQGRLVWRRDDITAESLLNFSDPYGIDAVSENSFSAFIMSTDSDKLQRLTEVLTLDVDIDHFFRDNATAAICSEKVPQLRAYMQRLHAALQQAPRAQDSVVLQEELEGNLQLQLLYTLTDRQAPRLHRAAPVRGNVLGRAMDYIDHHAREAITVQQLCDETAVSWRTLERAFRSHFQVTPKAYLKCVRLNGVKAELLAAPKEAKVLDVASRWGFWHSGQFASDYRKHFGELPTDTRLK